MSTPDAFSVYLSEWRTKLAWAVFMPDREENEAEALERVIREEEAEFERETAKWRELGYLTDQDELDKLNED